MSIEASNLPRDVKMGSDKSFGLVFAVVFLIVSCIPVFDGGQPFLPTLFGAAIFAVTALSKPSFLRPLNILWFKFGLLLHNIISPFILAIIFVITVIPTAFFVRLMGKDLLRLKQDPGTVSYWLHRDPPGPDPESLRRQF